MDFAWSPRLLELGEEAADLARRWTAEHPDEARDDTWIVSNSTEFAAELARRGWLGMTWPESEGGGGRPPIERLVVFEALIAGGAPVASCWFADRQIGPTLLEFGSTEQRARWLPGIIAGESLWCIGMSEPDAGSDVAAIRTRAERRGDDWIVNGQKVWTSGAALADWCYLIARTDPDAPPHKGLSELVVDIRSPGIEVRPIVDAVANEHFCEVHFSDVVVPGSHLVGAENGSFSQVMRQMEHERGGIDRLVSNRALYDDVVPLADHHDPLVRQEIAAIETGYRIGRLLVIREVLRQGPRGFSAATKTFCTEFEQRVADFCGRVLGAGTTAWDADDIDRRAARTARNICYAPGYTIMGGTTQVLRNILGERVLGLPREPRPPNA
ncbi:MAG: acyl-CoA dehydrogenase family protein [Acidimicrobiales bacterium]